MTDKPSRLDDKAKSSSGEEGGLSFHGIMKGLGKAKDAVVHTGGQVIDKGSELVKENAPKVKHAVQENAPKVKQAAMDAADSKAGKAVIGVGKEVYEEEKATGKRVAGAAKRGDYVAVAKEVGPAVVLGPQGMIVEKVGGKVMQKGFEQLPTEHQGTAKTALELGKIAHGGLPDAKHVITGAVLDSDTRGKAMEAATGAGKKVWGWIKGGDGEADKAEAKQSAGKKGEVVDYPVEDRKPRDLPKQQATKK